MDRVAVFVDAGYFFAAGSALISGNGSQKRSLLEFDERAAIETLQEFSVEIANQRLLRIYWYDAAPGKTGPTGEHVRLAHCDNVKVRLGFLNSEGQQKGVDSLIVTDLIDLARNRAIADAVLISGDEDVRIGVVLAQSFGVRVHLIGIHPGRGTQSLQLMQEADTCTEWSVETLRKMLTIRVADIEPGMPASRPKQAAMLRTTYRVDANASALLDGIVSHLLASLSNAEISAAAAYVANNRNNVPPEFDGKLLARSRAVCERNLNIDECRYVRDRFRAAVKQAGRAGKA
jgi:uncharacterized LabA/DUF88 family protein